MQSSWWSVLLELSRPDWRPIPGGGQSERLTFDWNRRPELGSLETLAGLGRMFRAEWVRIWQIRGKKPVRFVGEWSPLPSKDPASLPALQLQQDSKFQRLIALAVEQQRPIWVEGDSPLLDVSSEPLLPVNDDHPRMFTWVPITRSQRNVLEIGLGPDRSRVTAGDRELYLRAMHQLRDEMGRLIGVSSILPKARLTLPKDAQAHPLANRSADDSIAAIVDLASTLETLRAQAQRQIELKLALLEGMRLDSLQANQLLAKSLHQLLDGHGFRLRCPECGQAAIMRCLAAGNSPTGSFVFDHYLPQGRTFHGGRSAIPKLAVLPKPARQANCVS